MSTVLVVDDEPDIRELLTMTLSHMKLKCDAAENLQQAKVFLEKNKYSLCLADMRLPDGDGIELVGFIQKNFSHIPVAIITAYSNVDSAVATLKEGAFDYVSKPIDLNILRDLVNTALKLSSLSGSEASPERTQDLLGKSASIRTLRKTISKLARSQAPVFINGESGTGKELVARLIHEQSARAENAFVPVNCGAIPSELMESEFFGHTKGSFTGAVDDKIGLFQAAHGGTLLLDEVAELPLHMQVKLLRAIQEKAVRPVGAQSEMPVDVRVLSASHKDLNHLVQQGEFRQDLFYRINVIELRVPSLRERIDDIPLLAESLLLRLGKSHQIVQPRLAKDSLDSLKCYSFPGNVRELENILERSLTLCENSVICASDLQFPQEIIQKNFHKPNSDIPHQ